MAENIELVTMKYLQDNPVQGPPGEDGANGSPGVDGKDGTNGKDGFGTEAQYNELLGEIQALKDRISELEPKE
ncbi:hypothetical protein [Lederbergia lenta]|uniref:hypothetical protein n=1 Tax=Lederbergia lenta TaxID=1467 RepID=UPI002041FE58|nr:hypothetical protein [Lederbergia lenta]MCM3110023.1 hypothetical protein [Lederbergia lenta]